MALFQTPPSRLVKLVTAIVMGIMIAIYTTVQALDAYGFGCSAGLLQWFQSFQ